MENLLLAFIQENWLPEKVTQYTEILDLLYAVVPQRVEGLDMYFMSVQEDRSSAEITDDIEHLMWDIVNDVLSDMGVFINEDANILDAMRIYQELIIIENNENVDYIMGVLESTDETPEDMLFAVLSNAGGLMLEEEAYHQTIRKILPDTSQKLLMKMMEIKATSIQVVDQETMNFRRLALGKVKVFCDKLNDSHFFMVEQIKNGCEIGLPFHVLMQHFGVEILNMDTKEAIYNLYLLALISKEAQSDPAGYLIRVIPTYLPDPNKIDFLSRTVRDMQIKLSVM